MTADAYTLEDLKQMEGKIIKTLEFNLNRSTTLQLLEAISENVPEKSLSLTKYLLELALFEDLPQKYESFTLVKSALSVAESVASIKFDMKSIPTTKTIPREEIVACFK